MKIKTGIILIFYTFTVSCSSLNNRSFLVGTYTNSASQGINLIEFNEKTKVVSLQKVIIGVENPSFVIANKAKNIIVTVEEIGTKEGGKVTSFSFDKKTKNCTKINSFYTKGDHPCTVAFSPNEKFVVVGNYSGGSLSVFPIDEKGSLSENCNFIQYEGSSLDKNRQESPHLHCVVFHPKKNIIAVADLGRDVIELIPYNENSKSFLVNEQSINTKLNPGSGPHHLIWNKNGTRLYVTFELTNQVGVFDYKNKTLNLVQTINLTKSKTSGSAAELRLSNDEQFLYVSVRGFDNHIVVMKITGEKIETIQTVLTEKTPRNFIITDNQKNVLVASQGSNLISVYDRDEKTGLLTKTSNSVSINQPVYLFPF